MIDCSDTFLSSDRTGDDEIAVKAKAVSMSVNVDSIINAMPCSVAVLDENRQIIHCNQHMLTVLGVDSLSDILGMRPGEAAGCAYLSTCKAGCGTSPYCNYCGAAQAIKLCQETGEKVTRECRLSSELPSGALDLSVTASPFEVEGEVYTLISILDISDSKRRSSLERTFFHDIANSAGCVNTALGVIDQCNEVEDIKQFAAIASTASLSLMDEIQCQRILLDAESHELSVVIEQYVVADIFRDLKDIWSPFSSGFDIELSFVSEVDYIETDIVVIKRIIGNLIKNAIEASNAGDSVTTSCFLSDEKKTVFSINNPVPLPDDVLNQMFQRSFTTKGVGHGLGTYSVKLLTEEYLNGTVSVVTDVRDGTTVFINV